MTSFQDLGFSSYQDYLRSAHWAAVKKRYRQSDREQACIHCGDPAYELHHLSYARLGRELLDDLVPLCRTHHGALEEAQSRGMTMEAVLAERQAAALEAEAHRQALDRSRAAEELARQRAAERANARERGFEALQRHAQAVGRLDVIQREGHEILRAILATKAAGVATASAEQVQALREQPGRLRAVIQEMDISIDQAASFFGEPAEETRAGLDERISRPRRTRISAAVGAAAALAVGPILWALGVPSPGAVGVALAAFILVVGAVYWLCRHQGWLLISGHLMATELVALAEETVLALEDDLASGELRLAEPSRPDEPSQDHESRP